MTAPVIEIQNLVVTYGGKPAVNDLTLSVPGGVVYGFLGPNGAGKTTTIKTLLGLRRPDRGRIQVLGLDAVTQSAQVRAQVGYVSEVNSLYDFMTVLELVAFCRDTAQRWNPALVEHYLEFFGLPRHQKLSQFSKGMKSQLALTLALGSEPELLILDEPTSGLDPLARRHVLNLLVGEIAGAGKTVFFSSHILAEVESVADWVGILRDGRLVVADTLDHLKQQQRVLRLTYAHAPTAREMNQLRRLEQVVSAEQEGRSVRVLVRGDLEEVARAVRALPTPPHALDAVELNLDDIFMLSLQERGDDRQRTA